MSPNIGKTTFTDDELADIRQSVKLLISSLNLTRRKVAEECDIAEGTFGPWLNGAYPGDNQPPAAKVWKWLKAREDKASIFRQVPIAPSFQRTRTATRILTVLDHAQFFSDMVVVGGGPGIGKSESARYHHANRPRVWLATMRPSSRGVNTALVAVLTAMGEADAKGTPQALSNRIVQRVREPGALIIIDEAQHLSQQAVDELRSIHDETKVGMAFVGDETVWSLFDGTKRAGFAQFFSRIGMRHRQSRPVDADVEVLAEAWAIDDKAILKRLKQISAKPGALRGVTKTLLTAKRMAAIDGEELTEQHILDAWAQLAPDLIL